MGPITDPVDYISQLNQIQRKKADLNNIAAGIKLFSLGLIKKVLLADTFAAAVTWTYENINAASSADCMLLMFFYASEIYFDFSGYSDIYSARRIEKRQVVHIPEYNDRILSERIMARRQLDIHTRIIRSVIYIYISFRNHINAFV